MIQISVDLRASLEPVRDQGRRPTCLAFAASSAHRVAHNHTAPLCAEWLYYLSNRKDGLRADQGCTVSSSREVILQTGQPDEDHWPYQGIDANPAPWEPPTNPPSLLKCASGARGNDPDQWRRELKRNVPVPIAIFISDVFFRPTSFVGPEAVISDDADPVDYARGHALVLCGAGRLGGIEMFLVRNSWGQNWGWDGHSWVPETYLTRRFADAFIIEQGASDDVSSNANRPHAGLRVG